MLTVMVDYNASAKLSFTVEKISQLNKAEVRGKAHMVTGLSWSIMTGRTTSDASDGLALFLQCNPGTVVCNEQ